MRFVVKHDGKGRIRVHLVQYRMSFREADTLQYYLEKLPFVKKAKVYEQTGDAAICYTGEKQKVLSALQRFSYEGVDVPENLLQNSGRELNAEYREKLITKVVVRYGKKWELPFIQEEAMQERCW